MSDQLDDVVENLKKTSVWQRVFFTLGFALLFNLILVPLVLLTTLVQVVFVLFSGEKNENVVELSDKVFAYVSQILRFILFLGDDKPFPFSDFPQPGQQSDEGVSEPEPSAASVPPDEPDSPEADADDQQARAAAAASSSSTPQG